MQAQRYHTLWHGRDWIVTLAIGSSTVGSGWRLFRHLMSEFILLVANKVVATRRQSHAWNRRDGTEQRPQANVAQQPAWSEMNSGNHRQSVLPDAVRRKSVVRKDRSLSDCDRGTLFQTQFNGGFV